MTSTTTIPNTSKEALACWYSSFNHADDEFITIIPSFDYDCNAASKNGASFFSLLPSNTQFQSGIPIQVPFWLAVSLQDKQLARIDPPDFLTVSNLQHIVEWERRHETLWENENASNNKNTADSASNSKNTEKYHLPSNYYELGTRLTSIPGIVFSADTNASVLSLLLADLLQVRLDKLQSQLPNFLASSDTEEEELILTINHMGTHEVSLLRPFLLQVLDDRALLLLDTARMQKSSSTTKMKKMRNQATADSTTTSSTTTGDADTTDNDKPRARIPLRQRHRG